MTSVLLPSTPADRAGSMDRSESAPRGPDGSAATHARPPPPGVNDPSGDSVGQPLSRFPSGPQARPVSQPPAYLHAAHRPSSLFRGGVDGVRVEASDVNLLPSRWWFAASAFPMVAGTLGPVASAFSICALVRPWRQVIVAGTTIENAPFVADPVWLTTINAVQLVVALVANLFLLLNMARRIRFAVAQPVTMVGWYISSFSLIALTATAEGPLKHPLLDGTLVWSQAFYYAIYSAILYFIVASLMNLTFYGAWTGHYAKDFQLTNSQRTLMLQTILFLVYLLVGALVFSTIEGWAFLDAVYWADVTLFTVGFGDFAAETTLGRALLFPYALVGIISLSLVIGSIRSLVLDRGARTIDARMTEKNRRKFLGRLAKRGYDDILQPIHSDERNRDRHWEGDGDGHLSRRNSALSHLSHPRNAYGLTEFQRREEEFNFMRKIQHDAARKRRWVAVATSGGTWVALWLLGALIFMKAEEKYQNWDYFGGFYLAFVSLTTMGYGDMTPVSNAGRSFFVFWSLLALPTMTILISDMGDTIVKAIRDLTNAIGRITILPGERGLKRDLKEMVRMLTCGTVFGDVDIEDVPPGLLGAAQRTDEERAEVLAEDAADDAVDEEEPEEAVEEVDGDEDDDEDGNNGGDGDGGGNEDADDNACGSTSTQTDEKSAHENQGPDPVLHEKTSAPPAPPLSRSASLDIGLQPRMRLPHSSTTVSLNSTGTAGTAGTATSAFTASPHYHRHRHRRHQSVRSPLGTFSSAIPSMPRIDFPQNIPATRAAYHCLLIDEIAQVTQHLRHTPPRKYTFAEWAWFLRLMGEDEQKAETHRAAAPGGGSHDNGTANEDDHPSSWSWVGARSPLMGSQEEAEWVLDKLLRRLRAELQAEAAEAGVADMVAGVEAAVEAAERVYSLRGQTAYSASRTTDANPDVDSTLVRRPTHPIPEEP